MKCDECLKKEDRCADCGKETGERLAKTGEIVYMSKVDNTVNVKCHFSGMVVNVGKEILRFNSLPSNPKNYGDTSC